MNSLPDILSSHELGFDIRKPLMREEMSTTSRRILFFSRERILHGKLYPHDSALGPYVSNCLAERVVRDRPVSPTLLLPS
jgi:hypothetical protein